MNYFLLGLRYRSNFRTGLSFLEMLVSYFIMVDLSTGSCLRTSKRLVWGNLIGCVSLVFLALFCLVFVIYFPLFLYFSYFVLKCRKRRFLLSFSVEFQEFWSVVAWTGKEESNWSSEGTSRRVQAQATGEYTVQGG